VEVEGVKGIEVEGVGGLVVELMVVEGLSVLSSRIIHSWSPSLSNTML
jgi:hypothetical protein